MKKFVIIIIIIGIVIAFWILLAFFSTDSSSAPVPNNPITINNPITSPSMIITSPSFNDGENIPAKFTCSGDPPAGDINPELQIQNVPSEASSLALIMDDPDAPSGVFTHWTAWNIDPKTKVIKEESVPPGSIEGRTDFNRTGYGGPCPPPGKPHHYRFKLYALDATLNLKSGATVNMLAAEINKHLIAKAELVGLYQR